MTEMGERITRGILEQIACDISTSAVETAPLPSVVRHNLADLAEAHRASQQGSTYQLIMYSTSPHGPLYTEPGPNPVMNVTHWGGGGGGCTRSGHPAPGQPIDAYVEECPDPVRREPDWDDHGRSGPWARGMSRSVYEHERRTATLAAVGMMGDGSHRGLYGITHDGLENGCELCAEATVRSVPEAAAVAGTEVYEPVWDVRWWQLPWFWLLRLASHRQRRAPLDWAEVNRMERQEGLVLTRPWREEALAPEKR